LGYDDPTADFPNFLKRAVAANKPDPALETGQSGKPSALSAVFRRLAKEEPVLEPPAGFEGFGEASAVGQPTASKPPASERQTLRDRVRDWLGDAPPSFAALPEAEARALPPSPAARPATASPATRPAGASPAADAAPDRPGHPSTPRNRRLYRRVQLPAEMEIAGVPCSLIDVSIGGFAATGVPPIEPNAPVQVTIRLVIDGIEVGTQLDARIIYVTHGRSSGRFIDLSASQAAFLRYLVTWRGESIGAVGTTTLLDAITGGPMRDLDGANRFGAPRARRWTGWLGRKAR
jgi:hypothetical protein